MKTGLVVFGVIFLVIGALLYYIPVQQIKADTTTSGGGTTDTRTSSASITVPAGWAYASAAIGSILFFLGLAIPNSSSKNNTKKDSYEKVSESKEKVNENGNKRNVHSITKERSEK